MRAILFLCAVSSFSLAACGGGSNSCEDAIANAAKLYGFGGDGYAGVRAKAIAECKSDKWSDKVRTCVVGAKTQKDLDACEKYKTEAPAGGDADDYAKKSKASEAEITLGALQKHLKIFFAENAMYPKGAAPRTPAAPCCEGPNHKCAPNPADWSGNEVWTALDFSVEEPGYFQFSYASSDANQATVEAVGDLDCDGTSITYTLTCTATDGMPSCTISKPAPNTD